MNIETFICQAQIWISIKAFALETRSALITVPRHLYVKIRIEKRTDYTCPDIEPIRFVDGD